jgi:hypothetical protein
MANGHGGPRVRAGRPKKVIQYAEQIESSDDKIAGKLDDLTEVLLKRGLKGLKLTRETFKPAGLVMVDDTEIVHGEHGPKSVKVKRLAFPDKEADEQVLVSRVIIETAPDVKVAQYLINRVAGTPVQQVEAEVKEVQELPDTLEAAIMEAYGPGDDADDDDIEDDFLNELDEDTGEPEALQNEE